MSRLFILYLCSLMLRSLCIGVLGLLGTLFLKSVARRHALWCAVLAAMLLMPVLDGILPRSTIAVPVQRIAAFETPAGNYSSTSLIVPPTAVLSPGPRALKTSKDLDLWTAASVLYACVTALLLFRFAWAYRTVLGLKASSREISLPLRNEVGGPNAPAVYESEAVNVPLAGGFRSPFVLLPASWRMWDEWKLRAVLSHEFTHIRRGDPLIHMIAAINTAAYWFNPLSWFVEGMLSSLAEKASDEEAVLRNGDPARYAQVLLQFARSAQKRGRMGLTNVAMAKHKIHWRIERVLHLESPRNGVVTKTGWITTAIVAMPIVYAASALQVAPAVETIRTAQSASEPVRFQAAPPIVLAAQTVPGAPARDITGTWQGKQPLPQAPNGELRVVFKILKADDGTFKATLYTIDQPGPGYPGTAAVIQGSNVEITIPGVGGTYEGKLDADAITLTGKWILGVGNSFPMTLAHVKDDAAWEIPKPPAPPKMMAADADPEFEVAVIKLSDPNRRRLYSIGSTEVSAVGATVHDLIVFSFGVHASQISGAPAWIESDKFDIRGKAQGGAQPNPIQFKAMLRKLLADRFQLAFHRDQKQLAVYALTVGKNGPKLTRSEANSSIPNLVRRGPGNLPARNVTMEEFAGNLQAAVLDRPVIDQTGLKGRFDFQLQWTPDETQFALTGGPGAPPKPPEGAETPPDLFTAIQQQLGLKLESARAQIDVLVIDKVEKPSEN